MPSETIHLTLGGVRNFLEALWLEPLKASLISGVGMCQPRKNDPLLNHRHAGVFCNCYPCRGQPAWVAKEKLKLHSEMTALLSSEIQ